MTTKFQWKKLLVQIIVLFNAAIFILYGTVKLIGLQLVHVEPAADLLFKDVSPSHIMWQFFGLKKGYIILIGLSELIPGVLLLFKRTRFLGSILYLFTVTNVLAINIFFVVTTNTLTLSIVLFVNTLIILFSERQKLKPLLS
ncbi:MAG: hypothetical protein ABIQ40_15345 [Bacteroidia bacterium]